MCKKLQNVTKMNKVICKLLKSWRKNNILTAEIGKLCWFSLQQVKNMGQGSLYHCDL